MTPAKPAPLLLGARAVDATPTDPPAGYVPTQTGPPADPPAADSSAAAAAGGEQEEEAEPVTYASEHQVQAARLAVRAYARHRDALAAKAAAALAALDGLRANGGNDAQTKMVLADARVRLSEILRAAAK